jgi:hypothetical protein
MAAHFEHDEAGEQCRPEELADYASRLHKLRRRMDRHDVAVAGRGERDETDRRYSVGASSNDTSLDALGIARPTKAQTFEGERDHQIKQHRTDHR